MKKRKLFCASLLLICALSSVVLTGCGQAKETAAPGVSASPEVTAASPVAVLESDATVTPTAAPSEKPVKSEVPVTQTEAPAERTSVPSTVAAVTEQVVDSDIPAIVSTPVPVTEATATPLVTVESTPVPVSDPTPAPTSEPTVEATVVPTESPVSDQMEETAVESQESHSEWTKPKL